MDIRRTKKQQTVSRRAKPGPLILPEFPVAPPLPLLPPLPPALMPLPTPTAFNNAFAATNSVSDNAFAATNSVSDNAFAATNSVSDNAFAAISVSDTAAISVDSATVPSIVNSVQVVRYQTRIHAIRGWHGPSTDGMCSGPTADGLVFPNKMKTFWVIKYLNIYSINK